MKSAPVLFLIYNRPDKTEKVFDAIRKAKPNRLFVVADGPKTQADIIKCQQTRDIIKLIDWNCELQTNFRDSNLGSKYSVSNGINWFFQHVDEGLILEDDCIPSESFFFICTELLSHYRHNEKIMHITASNLNDQKKFSEHTYYFSRFPNIWGWATWRRAWAKYDLELSDRNFYHQLVKTRFRDPFEKQFWTTVLDTLHTMDAWDYQWMFSIWRADGLCINLNHNLVSNIGFDSSATHTKYESNNSGLPVRTIKQIIHPQRVTIDKKAEAELLRSLHSLERRGYKGFFFQRFRNLIHKLKLFIYLKKK